MYWCIIEHAQIIVYKDRMFRFLAFWIVLIASAAAGAAEPVYPELPETGQTYRDWIPEGWTTRMVTSGDLNDDNLIDEALIVERREPIEHVPGCDGKRVVSRSRPLVLIVLIAEAENAYRMVASSPFIVLREDEGGPNEDPLNIFLYQSRFTAFDFRAPG